MASDGWANSARWRRRRSAWAAWPLWVALAAGCMQAPAARVAPAHGPGVVRIAPTAPVVDAPPAHGPPIELADAARAPDLYVAPLKPGGEPPAKPAFTGAIDARAGGPAWIGEELGGALARAGGSAPRGRPDLVLRSRYTLSAAPSYRADRRIVRWELTIDAVDAPGRRIARSLTLRGSGAGEGAGGAEAAAARMARGALREHVDLFLMESLDDLRMRPGGA